MNFFFVSNFFGFPRSIKTLSQKAKSIAANWRLQIEIRGTKSLIGTDGYTCGKTSNLSCLQKFHEPFNELGVLLLSRKFHRSVPCPMNYNLSSVGEIGCDFLHVFYRSFSVPITIDEDHGDFAPHRNPKIVAYVRTGPNFRSGQERSKI